MADLGALSVSPQSTPLILGDNSDGITNEFGIPHVVAMSATRVVVTVPWRLASYAPFSYLRCILLDQTGTQIAVTNLPWIQSADMTEVPLTRVDNTHLIEATYVGSVSTSITGVTARRITVADSGFTVDYTTTSASDLMVTGLALAPGLDMVVASGHLAPYGYTPNEGFMAFDVATGAILWTAAETVTAPKRPEFITGPGGALTFYYFASGNQPSSHSWTITRTGATPNGAAGAEPFAVVTSSTVGWHTNPAYTSTSSLTVYAAGNVTCYASNATPPTTPVSTTAELVSPFTLYQRSTIEDGASPGAVAVDLGYTSSGAATLVTHTPDGVVAQVAMPDLLLNFGYVRYECGDAGLGAVAKLDGIAIGGGSPYYYAVVRIWMFTVELLLVTIPPPLRQVQRDDGLGRSTLRGRGGSSVQRSLRQRGYR